MDQSQSLIRCLDHTVSAKTQRMRGWWMGSLTVSFKEGEKEYSTQHHIFNQGLWPPSQHPLMSWFKTKCPGWSNLWSLKSEISLRGASTFSLSFCFMLIQSSTWLSPQSKLSTKKKKKKKKTVHIAGCPQSATNWVNPIRNAVYTIEIRYLDKWEFPVSAWSTTSKMFSNIKGSLFQCTLKKCTFFRGKT